MRLAQQLEREKTNQSRFTAQGIDVRFARESLKGPTDWSFSEDHHVIVVHRAGQLTRLTTEFSTGLRAETLPQAGDCWVIPAGARYSAQALGTRVDYCELHLPVRTVRRSVEAAAGAQHPFLYHAVEQLATITPAEDDLAGLLRETVVHGIRLYLGQREQGQTSRDDSEPDLIASLECYLRDTLSRRHTLDEMAHFTGLAPSTLLRQFRRSFGKTPYRWLLEERIQHAKGLLGGSTIPITEIALDSGFSTPSHFSGQFRKLVGCSPRDYRTMSQR
jgi:AraC family transcriptional regulator